MKSPSKTLLILLLSFFFFNFSHSYEPHSNIFFFSRGLEQTQDESGKELSLPHN